LFGDGVERIISTGVFADIAAASGQLLTKDWRVTEDDGSSYGG
jgi:hypothetical protein